MTGAEVAGLALVVLPLVVNQLDNYLEGYSSTLSAQYAIFLNTLEIFLQDVVDDHDDRSELISKPGGPGWKDAQFQRRMAERLGRDYNVFTGTLTGLCGLLEGLSNKLDRYTPDYSKAASIKSLGKIKFRKILSKAIYEDILNRIDKASQILKTLSDQSHQLAQTRSGPARWKGGLRRHQETRRHARALHDLLVQGQGLKFPCRNDHTVCFRLDTTVQGSRHADHLGNKSRFLLMLSSANKGQRLHTFDQWHEVELQPERIEQTVSINLKGTSASTSEGKCKVQCPTMSSTTICMEGMDKALKSPRPISDFCSVLCTAGTADSHSGQGGFGYIKDQTSDTRFTLRLGSDALSRRDRLFLAAVLACGVLQLQGSWLKPEWATKDVFFAPNLQQRYTMFDHPYIVWQVMGSLHTHGDNGVSSRSMDSGTCRIQNEILLPLAVALIELSLGKTISALCRPEDQDPSESQLRFNTATRVLRNVYYESGSNYGDVVKECLYWSRNKGERFEDPQFDESVLTTVVFPLLKDLDYFDGISR
ncbi:uncharacterized protein CDV56_105901 [Aspergillus thermomutatus]|uniref:DUF7580 domain-containing protein n=1 Tax=Aspergillus thermomutatus TaxID=41047 RepID=A0A397H0L4_ASPTH|nr:uncharacterized protein CDV56_105901 [Aspergillus thermomutatus]RHZ55166.1 hypothetical protein CDV56_105901 [Aspergillus thermomutatus]